MNQIIVGISEEAQRAAARAGQPAQAVQAYELPADLVVRALDLGADVAVDGAVTLACGAYRERHGEPWTRLPSYSGEAWAVLPARPADAAAALDAIEAVRAARAAEVARREEEGRRAEAAAEAREAERVVACEAYLAELERDPTPATGASGAWSTCSLPYDAARGRLDGDGYGWPDALKPRLAALRERVEAEHNARVRERLAAEAVAETTRTARLAELCREHGDESVRARLAAGSGPLGLLPAGEAREVVRAWALPVGGELHEYRRGTASDVEHAVAEDESGGEYECEGTVSWRALPPEAADGLTRDQWSEVEVVRAALLAADLPAGDVRVHRGECDECREVVERIGVLVRRDLGSGLVVEREYQATE